MSENKSETADAEAQADRSDHKIETTLALFKARLEPDHFSQPLAAMEIGFHARLVRRKQQSIWMGKWNQPDEVWPHLGNIEREARVLGRTLTKPAGREIRDQLADHHDAASAFAIGLLGPWNTTEELRSSLQQWPQRLREKDTEPWRQDQREHWLKLNSYLKTDILNSSRGLIAWYWVGDSLADVMGRAGDESLSELDLEDMVWDRLFRGVEYLDGKERQLVEEFMPRCARSVIHLGWQVLDTLSDLRQVLRGWNQPQAQLPQLEVHDKVCRLLFCGKAANVRHQKNTVQIKILKLFNEKGWNRSIEIDEHEIHYEQLHNACKNLTKRFKADGVPMRISAMVGGARWICPVCPERLD